MTQDFSTALMLMGVGMITVFVVLSLVVLVGNGLVSFVNKFVPDSLSVQSNNQQTTIDPAKIAAITAAVEIFTNGKGQVDKIEKV